MCILTLQVLMIVKVCWKPLYLTFFFTWHPKIIARGLSLALLSMFPKWICCSVIHNLSPKFFEVGYGFSTDLSGLATCILFPLSILSEVIVSATSLIDMSFLTTTMLFLVFLYLFLSPQLESTHSFLWVH